MRYIILPLLFLGLFSQAQPYKKIHFNAILVDTHNDIPSASIQKQVKFDSDLKGKTHSDLKRMLDGGVDVQIFSIFCGPEQQQPYLFANRQIDSVYEWARRNPDRMVLVRTPAELRKAVR